MEVHTVHDREPFPGWDSGTGLQQGERGGRQKPEGPQRPEEDSEQGDDSVQ